MGILLQDLLNEVVVTPYDAEITGRLDAICHTYAKGSSVFDLDDYIAAFVFNKPDMAFKSAVEQKYSAVYPTEEPIVLPPIFAIVLAQYITVLAITSYLTEEEQAIASLVVMNYMLYRKGTLTRLILPNHIKSMYSKMDDFVARREDIPSEKVFNYMKAILSNPDYLEEHYQERDLKKGVREMARMAYLYQQGFIVDKFKSRSDNKPYARVYGFVDDLLKNTPSKFSQIDIVKILRDVITEDEQKKVATIDSIVKELIEAGFKPPFNTIEKSSLLLSYVLSRDSIPQEIKNRRLTVIEFGVYIFNELLLEYIVYEHYGEGE